MNTMSLTSFFYSILIAFVHMLLKANTSLEKVQGLQGMDQHGVAMVFTDAFDINIPSTPVLNEI